MAAPKQAESPILRKSLGNINCDQGSVQSVEHCKAASSSIPCNTFIVMAAIKDEQYMLNCYDVAYQAEWPHTCHSLLSVWCGTADALPVSLHSTKKQ
jgi:hypothetical protein